MREEYKDYYKKLGLKISYYRKLRSFTQESLAESIRKSPTFISHVEAPNIYKAISWDTLFDIACVLDIPAYKFLNSEDDLL